jgi:hypothetical protein
MDSTFYIDNATYPLCLRTTLKYFMIIFGDSHFIENHGEQFSIWDSPRVIHIDFQSPSPM